MLKDQILIKGYPECSHEHLLDFWQESDSKRLESWTCSFSFEALVFLEASFVHSRHLERHENATVTELTRTGTFGLVGGGESECLG